MRDAGDVVARGDHAFREEEADGQLAVVTGGPHGDRERLARRPDLQRFLENDLVFRRVLQRAGGDAPNLPAPHTFYRRRHDSFIFRRPSSSTCAVNSIPQ